MKKYSIKPSDMKKIKKYLKDTPKLKKKVVKTLKKNIPNFNFNNVLSKIPNCFRRKNEVRPFKISDSNLVLSGKKSSILKPIIGVTLAAVSAVAVSVIAINCSKKDRSIIIKSSK